MTTYKDMAEQNEMDGYSKIDKYDLELVEKNAKLYSSIISNLGEDVKREGLLKTPERVSKAMQYLTHGYDQNPAEILKSAMFKDDYRQMVIVKYIEIYSLCEHHLLPFFGKAHVAYIPNGCIVGLSKIPRVVDAFARRLQVQERLTTQVASALEKYLEPKGVGVVVEAYHLCMMMRGVQKQNSSTITSCMLGRFKSDSKTRSEFLDFIK